MDQDTFKEAASQLRDTLEAIKKHSQGLMLDLGNGVFEMPNTADSREIMANLVLAYRHLEDARMRVGKAIQAYDGGESCYPR